MEENSSSLLHQGMCQHGGEREEHPDRSTERRRDEEEGKGEGKERSEVV